MFNIKKKEKEEKFRIKRRRRKEKRLMKSVVRIIMLFMHLKRAF